MSRTARRMSNSNIYHIILRGVNHNIIFEEDSDYQLFLDILSFYKAECKYEIFAYCLMTNHVHLLLRFPDGNLSDSMKKIEDKFIWRFNRKHDRCGHLFQERFKSEPVESERYLTTVFRYIHQNPLKAGLICNIQDYKWSSYKNYLYGKAEFVDISFMIDIFGNPSALIHYVCEKNDDICMENLTIKMNDDDILKAIKERYNCACIADFRNLPTNTIIPFLHFLLAHGASQRQISRVTGYSRTTIAKLLS